MSTETQEWLSTNVLVGYGHRAWHFNADMDAALEQSTHYDGAIPVEDVRDRLFHWTCEQAPMVIETPFGLKEVPGHFANYRSDNGDPLGVVSRKYGIHQYQDSLLGGVQKITGSGLGINSAGLLQGGAKGWVSVSLADTYTTQSGVEFLSHLLAFGSHDGSLKTSYKLVNTLVVCDNTLGMAMDEKNRPEFKIRHTKNSSLKVESAQQALGLILRGVEETDAYISELCNTPFSETNWDEFVDTYVPMPEEGDNVTSRGATMAENKRQRLHSMWGSDFRVAPWRGTLFGVVQAVNTDATHNAIVRGTNRAERNMLSTLTGGFDDLDRQTLTTARAILAR